MENTTEVQGVASQSPDQKTNSIPGAAPGETVSETMARMYKVKVDGQEIEVDEEELKKGYSHSKAAEKRMQEASLSRKEAETVLRMFKESPRQAMQQLGLDVRKLAEEVIQDELRDAMLTPEQKELRKYKGELERYQTSEKEARAQYEKQQQDAEMERYTETIQNEIVQTLNTAGLPRTEKTISRIAYYMQSALAAGFGNVTPDDVIEYVKKDYVTDIQSMVGGLSEEQIEAFLGADVLRKVAKSTVKTGMTRNVVSRSVNENKTSRTEKKPVSPREYFKRH
jgi:hypothetical protein